MNVWDERALLELAQGYADKNIGSVVTGTEFRTNSSGTGLVLKVYRKTEDVDFQNLFIEQSENSSFDQLEYIPENATSISSKSKKSWTKAWKEYCDRLKISHVLFSKNTVLSHSFLPIRIRPHILPYYAIFIFDDIIVTVVPELSPDWIPLETILRFHHSHIDYDSQALQFLSVSLSELFSQLHSLSLACALSLDSLLCDNALWLLFDPVQAVFTSQSSDDLPLEHYTQKWVSREMSNYDYLMKLNEKAGRKRGDVHNHPIFPWVCDFSSKDGGWRPLNRTKYRLNKGDDQLREMSSRTPSHHIPELLSDIGYMVYRARVETKDQLCKHVRAKWVPLEYPVSMLRMYEWTPDECIPEFYDSPEILVSSHSDMPSLELPPFVKDEQEFIDWHRARLESDEVSQHLHKWIDLTFGYLLDGEDAVRALNVHLARVQPRTRRLRSCGVVQLFDRAHPRRAIRGRERELETLLRNEANKISEVEVSKEADASNGESLLDIYRKLKHQRDKMHQLEVRQMKSILELLTLIGLAPKACGQFERGRIKHLLGQSAYFLPTAFQSVLSALLLEDSQLPSPSLFPLHLIISLNIPFTIIDEHDQLAQFYSYHLLRKTAVVKSDEKRLQSTLVRELDSLRAFIQSVCHLEFVVVPLFERLIMDSTSAITAVHRLFGVLCRSLSDESLRQLIAPLTALLSCESSIKLLDRRFLLPVSIVYGAPVFLDVFLPPIVEAAAAKQLDRSIVAKDSIMWLSKRYGPVVCAKFISSNLLRILATCYDGLQLMGKDQEPKSVFDLPLEGDEWGARVEASLLEISASYSVTFVTVQYLPFCVDFVDQCFRRLTSSVEAGLVAVFRIVGLSVKAMTDHQLMNYLEDYIVEKVLVRVLEKCLLDSAPFSSDRNRIIVLTRACCLLYDICIRIGAENTRMHAKRPFEILFETFSKQYETDEELNITPRIKKEEESWFRVPLWVVSSIINRFSDAWGVPLLSPLCPDPAFLVPFVSSRAVPGSPAAPPPMSFNLGCFPSGNRLFSLSSSSPSPSNVGGVGPCDSGSLSALWCARVSAAACSNTGRKSFRFDHLSLCSFEGHSASLRCLAALSNENSFISGAADKTVKLWSMRPEQDRVEAQWTYRGHNRNIYDVIALEGNMIASTDGSIHVWDPFRGSLVFQADWQDGTVCSLSRLDRSTVAAISTLHSSVRLLDVRSGEWCSEMKASCLPGFTRALAVRDSGAKLAVSLSNGTIMVGDGRTGKLCSLSHGNNTHATSIAWLSSSQFIVTDSDEPAVVYSCSPRILASRRLPEVVTSAYVSETLLTTIQNNNTLRVYSGEDLCLDTRVKADVLSGLPTVCLHLPLNNAYLIGSSQGALKLMC